MRGRLWLVLLFGFLMVAVSASVANASRKVSLTDTLEVAATVEKYAVSFIKNPLTFNISGAVGSYRETKTATYSLEVNTPVRVVFSASPLAYISDPRYVLDVTYWVNSHRSKFRPGEDLTLIANYAGVQTLNYEIFGEVVIHQVSAQPAGQYAGVITVTVSAL